MAKQKVSAEKLKEIEELASNWGKIVARRVLDEQDTRAELDLQDMEEITEKATAGLTQGVFDALIKAKTEALGKEQPCPDCQRLCLVETADRPLFIQGGQINFQEPECYCLACRRDFFPLRVSLRLDNHGYSPTVMCMIVEAVARHGSFAQAAGSLSAAKVKISSRHVGRICLEIGTEMAQQRDSKVLLHRQQQLHVQVALVPKVVAVQVDGGRLRTRAVGCGTGVYDKQNKETKIACLVTLQSEPSKADPQPLPPPSLLLPRRIKRLVEEIHGKTIGKPEKDTQKGDTAEGGDAGRGGYEGKAAPRKLVRTCVASMAASHSFGPMVAAEAQERGFYQAQRRAFLGDGAPYNWAIQQDYFSDFEPIADFLHVLCYVYLGAYAVQSEQNEEAQWGKYVQWLKACWQGRVEEVIEELEDWQRRFGKPSDKEKVPALDPRLLVKESLTYLKNNENRMDYPRYRQQGLPCTSSLVESLVGQFNTRVKSSRKFWNRNEGSEAILQLRAAFLSEDNRLPRYFARRPGNPRRSYS